jgi:hypothetical protein
MDLVAFTMDTDWSPAGGIEYVLETIVDPRLALTVFCTGRYPALERRPLTEIALHYNVDHQGFEAAYRRAAVELPDAKGARGHSLAMSERLRALYREYGTRYDSSYIMFECQGIVPFLISRNVWEFPIYFMDMFFLEFHEGDFALAPTGRQLSGPGLKVLDFHPVHLLLNTPSLEYYHECKGHYHDVDALLRRRYPGRGITTLFLELQDHLISRSVSQTTLLRLADHLCASDGHDQVGRVPFDGSTGRAMASR